MSRLVASAPGKLLLGGEYAVLDGAPAIAMAIDRRAVVTVEPAAASNTVRTAGEPTADAAFGIADSGLSWLDGGDRQPLFEAVWAASAVPARPPLAFLLDTRGFHDPASGTKFGLGSSAAITAALATALAALGGRDPGVVAQEAHRRFQGGRGSGADVACSLLGGIVEYRMPGSSSPLGWPPGLESAVLWSGRAANTRAKLDRLGDRAGSRSRRELAEAAERLVSVFRQADSGAILDQLRDYTQVLARFDVDHGLGIFDAGHATLAGAAAGFGVVYKPCGAGGGDTGIALARDREALRSFVEFAASHRLRELGTAIDPLGAAVDGEPPA